MGCMAHSPVSDMHIETKEDVVNAAAPDRRKISRRSGMLVFLTLVVILAGWLAAPAGLLGKADAIGYAVCHRIDLRSFHLGERQLPLCARCTGTFLGVLAGAAVLFAAGRGGAGNWPSRRITAVLAFSIVPWGLDGLNSYLTLVPSLPHLYTPQNWLRLTTGAFLGLSMAVLFIPAVNQTVWRNPTGVPILRHLRELLAYYAIAPVLIFLILMENPVILFPLAILSTLGVLFLLTGVYLTVVLLLLHRENRIERRSEVLPFLLAGFILAIGQIAAIDLVRFLFTRTWSGPSLGG
jgi:uncharacterized membrane protein